MKKRTILVFGLMPFLVGFYASYMHAKPLVNTSTTTFYQNHIMGSDTVTLSNQGDIFLLTKDTVTQITHNQDLIEPSIVGNNIIAVNKTVNYASLIMYDQHGTLVKTIFNGSSNSIDTAKWISDPAVNPTQDRIAYVSDKDKGQTELPDNALYVTNLIDNLSTNLANPNPYSGGIAHPAWNPVHPSIVIYDFYAYDPKTLAPYSTILAYDKPRETTRALTTEKQNAYQGAFSYDGKQLLFLGRNDAANNVTMYVATITPDGINNTHALMTGDIAYPSFSFTRNHIYYLQAQGNSGYDLMSATIAGTTLRDIMPITSGSHLLGNSSFSITKRILQ